MKNYIGVPMVMLKQYFKNIKRKTDEEIRTSRKKENTKQGEKEND